MNKNKDSLHDDLKEKLELANRIAKQSQKVSKTYASFETMILKFVRMISSFIDRILFNSKYTIFVSLAIAILLFVSFNYSSDNPIFDTGVINSEKTVYNVPVYARYNSETFEINGIPKNMNVSLIGSAANVTAASNNEGRVEVNMEGYTEGTRKVKVTAVGFGNSVEARPSQSELTVTLTKKVTRQFELGYDFVNTDKLDSKYVLSSPEFENNKVNVRASMSTLDSIAFVKALIDVSNQTGDFEMEVPLIAYDKNGYPLNADISPSSVKVKVRVSTPSKTVPIVLETTGTLPNDLAIDTITMDHQSVTIYAPESVLTGVDKVVVKLDTSTLDKDSKVFLPVTLPTGVNNASITKVNLDIKLAEKSSRIIDDVKLNYRNNVGHFNDIKTDKTTVSVEVIGSQANIDAFTADDFEVYFDMSEAEAGTTKEYPLFVEMKSINKYVTVKTVDAVITVTIEESSLDSDE